MIRKPCCLIALVTVGAAAHCPASDYSFFFTVSNEVSPAWPEATVTLWASFAPWQYAFGQSNTSVWSDPDTGWFSGPGILLYQKLGDPGSASPEGNSVVDIRLFQFQWWQNSFADTANPIAAWSVTWTTDDFTPRTVPIWTQSSDFYVYKSAGGDWDNFYGPDFSEGQGFISVVEYGCYPDLTGDGVLDIFDFIAFINIFNAQEPMGDCDRNDLYDLFDFLCFVNAYNAGC